MASAPPSEGSGAKETRTEILESKTLLVGTKTTWTTELVGDVAVVYANAPTFPLPRKSCSVNGWAKPGNSTWCCGDCGELKPLLLKTGSAKPVPANRIRPPWPLIVL